MHTATHQTVPRQTHAASPLSHCSAIALHPPASLPLPLSIVTSSQKTDASMGAPAPLFPMRALPPFCGAEVALPPFCGAEVALLPRWATMARMTHGARAPPTKTLEAGRWGGLRSFPLARLTTGGRPTSSPTGSTMGWPSFFSSSQIHSESAALLLIRPDPRHGSQIHEAVAAAAAVGSLFLLFFHLLHGGRWILCCGWWIWWLPEILTETN